MPPKRATTKAAVKRETPEVIEIQQNEAILSQARSLLQCIWPSIYIGLWLPVALVQPATRFVAARAAKVIGVSFGLVIFFVICWRTIWPATLWASQMGVCAYAPRVAFQLQLPCQLSTRDDAHEMAALHPQILEQHSDLQERIIEALRKVAPALAEASVTLDGHVTVSRSSTATKPLLEDIRFGRDRARELNRLTRQPQSHVPESLIRISADALARFEDLVEDLQSFVTKVELSVAPMVTNPYLDVVIGNWNGWLSSLPQWLRHGSDVEGAAFLSEVKKALSSRVLEGREIRDSLRDLRALVQLFESALTSWGRDLHLEARELPSFLRGWMKMIATRARSPQTAVEEQLQRFRVIGETITEVWGRFDKVAIAVAKKRVQLDQALYSAELLSPDRADADAIVDRLRKAVEGL